MIGKNSLLFLLSHPLCKTTQKFSERGAKKTPFAKRVFPTNTPPKKNKNEVFCRLTNKT